MTIAVDLGRKANKQTNDTESRINELRFSDSVSLSFKTRLTLWLPVVAAMLHKVNFKHGTRDGKRDDVSSRK